MKTLSSEAQNPDYIDSHPMLVWDSLSATTSLRIRQSLHLPAILQMAVDEVYQLMKCDRVLLYQFAPDMSGQVIVEAISSPEWTLLNRVVRDPCFESSWITPYQENRFNAIDDVDTANFSSCYSDFLHQFQIKANLVIPVLNESQLWGLLIAHHCSAPRHWQPEEIKGLQQIAVHLGIAIHQSSLLEQLQAAKANLEAQVQARTLELTATNQQLLQSESRFQKIALSSPGGIYILARNLDGLLYFEYVSSAFENIFEITVKQALEDFNNYRASLKIGIGRTRFLRNWDRHIL